jgi:class 3 adenylate cyclase
MQSRPSGSGSGAPSRRLAAIAFVDIAAYTILMSRDETRTHQRWMRILNDVIRPQAEFFRGRIVKSTGDGVLVEFPSAHDAVEWARKVQQLAVVVQADGEGIAPSIALRISIHFADIITTEFDVFGDGVNVAARLQEHAAPGEIVLSEAAYDLVRGAVGADVRDLGYRHLKNLEKPVRIYALAAEAQGVAVPSLPREQQLPSIAVLPLWNQGGDPADDYFCDGVVEDIIPSR